MKLSVLITLLIVLSVVWSAIIFWTKRTRVCATRSPSAAAPSPSNLAASAKNPLVTQDELTLSLLVRDALKDDDVAYVIVADEDNQIVAHGESEF